MRMLLWKPTGALFFGVFTHNIVGDCRRAVGACRRLSATVGACRRLSAPVGELSAPDTADSCGRLSMKRVVKGLGSDGCGFSSVLASLRCMHACRLC